MAELDTKRMAIFVGDDYEDLELQYPKYRLREAGAQVVVAGLEAAVTYKGKNGYPQVSEARIADLSADDFDGLVIPGGWMPDKLRRHDEVLALTASLHKAGKVIASICHGPWIDISAGVVRGVHYTSTPGIKDDLTNAGAIWSDRPVVIDNHHISSRRPDDLPQFLQGILQALGAQVTQPA